MKTQNKKLIENAVVGIVTLDVPAELGGSANTAMEWQLKERFLQAAQVFARETGMTILNQAGDNFLFIANFEGRNDWARGLARFQSLLASEFQYVRIGVATGPVIVAKIEGRAEYLAAGAAINLAARLSAIAAKGGMEMSATAWETFRQIEGASAAMQAHAQLKGFDCVVYAFSANPFVVSQRDAIAA